MFIILIMALLTTLVVMSINSTYALSSYSYGYWSKDKLTVRFLNQEKQIISAVNSLCRTNYDFCKSKVDGTTGEIILNKTDLKDYMPTLNNIPSFSGFESINIDPTFRKLSIKSTFNDYDRKVEYKAGHIGIPGIITCTDGSAFPCGNNSLTKEVDLDPDTIIVFIDARISKIDTLLPITSGSVNADLAHEKQTLLSEKSDLETKISSRQNLIP